MKTATQVLDHSTEIYFFLTGAGEVDVSLPLHILSDCFCHLVFIVLIADKLFKSI